MEYEGISIFTLDESARSLKAIYKMIPYIKDSDITHVHLFPANYFAAISKAIARKPLVFTEHSTHNKRRDKKYLQSLEKWVYSRYDGISCISDSTYDKLSEWIGQSVLKHRGVIIENGIDLSLYNDSEPRDVKEIFGRDGLPILMISRFAPSKDHATVIRALKHIDNQRVFVAFAGDGETLEDIRLLAKETGVANKVVFLGKRNDIPLLIRNSFIGVQSSHWEGFGLTAIEMMAGGLPVIASKVDGLEHVVGDAALLFRKGDEMELLSHINRLIESKDLREKMVSRGKEKALEYSIESTAKKYNNLYQRILSER